MSNEATLFDQPKDAMSTNQLVEHHAAPDSVALSPAVILQRMVESGQDPRPMMDIFREWEDRIAAEQFGHALSAFQAKCPQIKKTRQIDLGGGKGPLFASLDDIDIVVKPILAECGLSTRFSASMTEAGQMKVTCFVRHGRHEESSEVTLPVPAQMRVNDTQKMGAALSYGKRYALCDALSIVITDEDRDSAGLHETITQEQFAILDEYLAQLPASETPKFLKYMDCETVEDIKVGDFDKAVMALKKKVQATR